MSHLRLSDLFAAALPTAAGFVFGTIATMTLSDWRDVASIVGTLLGAAYLFWKWRRESKIPPSSH